VVQQVNDRCAPLASRTQISLATGSRAYSRPRTAPPAAERVQALRSRAFKCPQPHAHISSSQISSVSKRYKHDFRSSPTSLSQFPSLQSAFPTKTVLALLVLGAVAYYVVEVTEPDWTDIAINSFNGENGPSTPVHFYKDKDEVDHWLGHHIQDASASLKDPEVLRLVNERFHQIAWGWEMSEEDSREFEMPVTHGCRFRSNEPCVSVTFFHGSTICLRSFESPPTDSPILHLGTAFSLDFKVLSLISPPIPIHTIPYQCYHPLTSTQEDFFAIGTAPGPGSNPWNYWSVYDGHAGRHTALYLQWTLHPNLSHALSNLSPTASSSTIHSTIKDVFLKTDNDIMTRARHAANWYPAANAAAINALTPAFSGSCALLAAFDPESNKLHVACVGDSRAVLGRWDELEGKYIALPLSVDQTGFNPSEVSRITAAHPDEPDILDPRSGRLLGLAVTRAFGDHRWKWDNDFIKQLQLKYWGSAPRPNSKTPPYMDAEPVITETEIIRTSTSPHDAQPGKSDFLILASDGLWDHISSSTAVQCVQSWLEARARGNGKVSADPHLTKPSFSNSPTLDPGVHYDIEKGEEVNWQAEPEYFAIEDDNAAVCLARNAMGGSRRGLFIGVLSVPGPLGRAAVDDTTVMVVFFDRVGEGKGGVGGNSVDGSAAGGKQKKKSVWWPW
jgi:serine/threonine protein phosphatase PrpC